MTVGKLHKLMKKLKVDFDEIFGKVEWKKGGLIWKAPRNLSEEMSQALCRKADDLESIREASAITASKSLLFDFSTLIGLATLQAN